MALNFPLNPIIGQQYDYPPYIYEWDGAKWLTLSAGSDTSQVLRDDLAADTGATLVGTSTGQTVQYELDNHTHTAEEVGALAVGGTAVAANKLSASRSIALTGDVTGSVLFDGTTNVSITTTVVDDLHNHTIANVDNLQTTLDGKLSTTGKASSASIADKLTTARTITLTGDATSTAISFDGTANISIPVTVVDDLHNHTIANVDNLQSTLDGKSPVSHTHTATDLGINYRKVITLNAPSGAAAGSWYPVLFDTPGGGLCAEIKISTRGAGGADPMNNNSISGFFHTGGWSDLRNSCLFNYVSYTTNERAIGCVAGGTESTDFVVFYIEGQAFPIRIEYNTNTATPITGTSVTFGTSTFTPSTNPGAPAGTKTSLIVDINKGNGTYNQNGRLYDPTFKPTSTEIGAMPVQDPGGVMEVGKYIDFHDTGTNVDFSARMTCTGSEVSFSGNGNFNDIYIRSDIRLKSNLNKLQSALDKVNKLTGYTYDKKPNTTSHITKREVGLIAQQLQEVLPEAICSSGDEDLLSISNSGVIALLVEAIKELSIEINALKPSHKPHSEDN